MDEKELLERAHQWFAITFEETAEQAGLNCVRIWYKPIMHRDLRIYKYAEVVFGPSEKEVNALIKSQKLIRWSLNVAIILLLGGMLLFLGCMFTGKIEILFWFAGGMGCFAVVLFNLGLYCTPLQKIWEGRVITYMDK